MVDIKFITKKPTRFEQFRKCKMFSKSNVQMPWGNENETSRDGFNADLQKHSLRGIT